MKRVLLGIGSLCALALVAAVFTTTAAAQSAGDSRIQRGFELAPVPLTMKGLNPALVGLGSYIVNAQGGCNDCHTNPPNAEGGDPYAGQAEKINAAGYLAGGTTFPPSPFVSRNLTPRAPNRMPAGLTFEQFLEVMHKGTDFKNRHPQISPLLQIMPWTVYGKMSDRDLEAVYEYLRSIPCIGSAERCGA
jgi:hypothetical protein